MTKVCVIGAGASGLAAAISAARNGAQVTVLEHKSSAAGKLRLTGNGRCNFTNRIMDASCYHEDNSSRAADVLNRFGTCEAVEFIESLGVRTHERFGYYYPEDERAAAVADALIRNCDELGVEFRYSSPEFIQPEVLFGEFDSLILATGGRSYKKTGSNGSGYRYLEALGIPYTWIMPALSALKSDSSFLMENAGKRIISTVSVYEKTSDGENVLIASDTGEVQINEGSLSGIPVMNLSRYVSGIMHEGKRAVLLLNFDPHPDDVPELLRERYRKSPGITMKQSTTELEINEIEKIEKAQVVRGGVELKLLTSDFKVINSDRIPKGRSVYVAGELCDVDGICGGYNLHWAWASGCIAGKASAC